MFVSGDYQNGFIELSVSVSGTYWLAVVFDLNVGFLME